MIEFRDAVAKQPGTQLIVHANEEGLRAGINPFTSGSRLHTDVMKTQALRQALDKYRFDAAFGGARRDEEKSRAKERIFSLRSAEHRWDPRNQRPEPWQLFNTQKAPERVSGCFRCRTGPRATFGTISPANGSTWYRCISPHHARWSGATAC